MPWIDRDSRRMGKARILVTPAAAGCGGVWADLGCGDGVFTRLLCELLQPGSHVYAVDKDPHVLRRLSRALEGWRQDVSVHPVHADFTQPLSLPPLDGLIMANSLHFVLDKKPLVARLVDMLVPGGRFIVVEYNARRGNYAVPYPLPDEGFLELAQQTGLSDPRIVARAPSSFLGEMYTGLAFRP
jgi:trans-aconitate methyltransferase